MKYPKNLKYLSLSAVLLCVCASPALAALELKYDMELVSKGKTDNCENTLLLGKEAIINSKRGRITLIDIARKEASLMGPEIGEKQYLKYSLHALVAMQAAMLSAYKDDFAAASSAGLSRPKAPFNPGIKVSETGNKLDFKYNDKEYVTVEFGDAFPAEYARAMEKVYIFSYRLHPFVRDQILARKKYVRSMVINDLNGDDALKTTLKLNSKNENADEPKIPADFQRVFNKKSPVYNLQKTVIDTTPLPPLPVKEKIFEQAKKMIDESRPVDAFLTMMEYGLTTSDQAIAENKVILDVAKKDPIVIKIAQNIVPDSEESAKAALKELSSIDQSKLEKGYLIEIFKADIEDQLEMDASADFVKALEKNPFITGAYKDLGDNFFGQGDFMNAWSCYEMFRKIHAKHLFIKDIEESEGVLEKTFPECYSL